MARGDMTGSIEMSKAAIDSLQSLPVTPLTTFLALEAMSSVVVDLSSAGESVDYVLPFAQMSAALLLTIHPAAASDTLLEPLLSRRLSCCGIFYESARNIQRSTVFVRLSVPWRNICPRH